MINRSLEPIGIKLDAGVKGTDAIKFAQDKVDEVYKAAIPKIGDVRIGDEQQNVLKKIAEDNKRKLGGEGGEYYNKFAGDVDDIIARAGDSKLISANDWHNIFKDIGEKAFDNRGFNVKGTQVEYGKALTKLKSAWMDIIEGTPGADLIKQANSAHSLLQVPQTAAGYLKTYSEKGGEFDPKDFLRALKAEASRKKFSAGEARLQDEALSVFQQIAKDKGSVVGLPDHILSAEEKEVFLTFKEINPYEIVRQNGIRQKHIDQAISLNLTFDPSDSPKYISEVHKLAWKEGIKTLYYMRSESILRGDNLQRTADCISCEG
jgi:hypothetical protein